MNEKYAPIIIFTYNRLDPLKRTVKSLQNNTLAKESELFVFSDAGKNMRDQIRVDKVRSYLRTVEGFKNITIYESSVNLGLAKSIINGVTKLITKYETVIVLEDDLQTSPNFLVYMNKSLNFYKTNKNIFSISGFSMPITGLTYSQVYFTKRASSWGWATWKDRWKLIDWSVSDYNSFKKSKQQRNQFNTMGSDLSGMLDRQMAGKINSWAIRWCYHQFKHNLFTVYPATSKVLNIGLENPESTHTNERFNRFKTVLDSSGNEVFNFQNVIQLDKATIRQFTKPYSISERIKYKILNSIF